MERTPFTVSTPSGELSGWVAGEGPHVLAIHGGPGMSYDYLDDAVAELAARYQVATFQQRGLAPSTEQGEFTVAEAVADIVTVLDGLGWETAYLMGHSWGGHLVFHAAADIPERLPSIRVPFGVVLGELSPMPPSAGKQSADRIPGAWWHVEPGAGHFVWVESPGCVLAAMDRLVTANVQ